MRKLSLQNVGIDEGEEIQGNGIDQIFNKIIDENFPKLKEQMSVNIQETYKPTVMAIPG